MENKTLKDSFEQMLKKIEQVKKNRVVDNKTKDVKIITQNEATE